jgi:CrcB protein
MTAPSSNGRPVAPTPLILGVLVTAVGGALGAVVRWWLTVALPVPAGEFPRTIFLVNVVGSGLLATLPLVPAIRERPWLVLLLGTGVLGGFTTMSAASVETFELLDRGHVGTGLAYGVGTLLAALAAVLLVERFSTSQDRGDVETEEGDR